MGNYLSKEFETCAHENIISMIDECAHAGDTGLYIRNLPEPVKTSLLLCLDTNWNEIEIRMVFNGDPNNYIESSASTDSPFALYLQENVPNGSEATRKASTFVQAAYGNMDANSGEGYVIFKVDYLDVTVAEYVDEVAYPLAERVAELFC